MIKRIAAQYIYTMESEAPLINAFVEFDSEDGSIVRTGYAEDGDTVVEGAIVPGFVNAHCHVELSHLHKKFYKSSGMAGFIDQINALRDWADRPVKQQLAKQWMDKMWGDGVSAMADISNDDSSFDVKKVHPMYTRTFLEVFGSEPEMCEGVMRDVTELNELAEKTGIDAAPTPHSCYTMSPQLLSASAEAGLKSGFLSYHSQESQQEEDLLISGSGEMFENRKRNGMSTPPVTGESSLRYFVDRLAAVRKAPYEENILLVHNVCLKQEDIDVAKKVMLHPYWALCPLSNLFIHDVLPPVMLMRKNNLDICIGTDSLSSNDDLDMIKEINCLHQNFPDLPMGEIFKWATLNGARFLKKDDFLGSIKEGKCPGLVLVSGLDKQGCVTGESRSKRIV